MPTYGQKITWTSFWGEKTSVEVDECVTREEAREDALRFAIKAGWTPPRWWEFWRWSDQPRDVTEEEIASLR